jgi:hypothetical protein
MRSPHSALSIILPTDANTKELAQRTARAVSADAAAATSAVPPWRLPVLQWLKLDAVVEVAEPHSVVELVQRVRVGERAQLEAWRARDAMRIRSAQRRRGRCSAQRAVEEKRPAKGRQRQERRLTAEDRGHVGVPRLGAMRVRFEVAVDEAVRLAAQLKLRRRTRAPGRRHPAHARTGSGGKRARTATAVAPLLPSTFSRPAPTVSEPTFLCALTSGRPRPARKCRARPHTSAACDSRDERQERIAHHHDEGHLQ